MSYGSATITFHIAAGLALTWVALWIIVGSDMPLEAPKIAPVDDFGIGEVSPNLSTTGKISAVEEDGLSPSKGESGGRRRPLNIREAMGIGVESSPAAAVKSRSTSRKSQQHANRRNVHQSVNSGGVDACTISNWSFPTTGFALPAHPEEEESDLDAHGGYSSPRSRARLDVAGFEGDDPDHDRGGGRVGERPSKDSNAGRTTAPITPPGAAAVECEAKRMEDQRPQASRTGFNTTTRPRHFGTLGAFAPSVPDFPWCLVAEPQQPSADSDCSEDASAAHTFSTSSHLEATEDGSHRPFRRTLITSVSFASGAARSANNRPKATNVWATSSSGGGSRGSSRRHSSTVSSSANEGEATAGGSKLPADDSAAPDRRVPGISAQEVEDGARIVISGRKPSPFSWREMLASPAAWAVVAGNVGAGTAINVVMSWLPTYFEELIQVDLSEIGLFAQVKFKRV